MRIIVISWRDSEEISSSSNIFSLWQPREREQPPKRSDSVRYDDIGLSTLSHQFQPVEITDDVDPATPFHSSPPHPFIDSYAHPNANQYDYAQLVSSKSRKQKRNFFFHKGITDKEPTRRDGSFSSD
jgi:hypothetical protein